MLSINNSSVVLNTVPDPPGPGTLAGGGVYQSGAGAVVAHNSLFGGNSAPVAADFAGSVNATNCFFQTAPTGVLSGSNSVIGKDPLLDPGGLKDHGGPTQTVALQSGSPAIGTADPSIGLVTDQRGYVLPAGSPLDIGSFQTSAIPDTTPPTATLALPAPGVTSGNATSLNPFTFTITFTDNQDIARASLAGSVVTLQPPDAAAPLITTVVSITPGGPADAAGDAPSEIVTYRFAPPGASWDAAPVGTYTILLQGAPVTDLASNSVATGSIGTFINAISSPSPTPSPTPASPHATSVVKRVHTKKGLTSVTVAFDAPLDPASANVTAHYRLLAGVKKRGKTVYKKVLVVRSATYDPVGHTVTLGLAKPFKGTVQVTVHGGIQGANGASTSGDFMAVVH